MGLPFHQGSIKLPLGMAPQVVVHLAFEPHASGSFTPRPPPITSRSAPRCTADPQGPGVGDGVRWWTWGQDGAVIMSQDLGFRLSELDSP